MGYFRKKRFSLGEVAGLLAIAFIGLAIIGYAASVTVTNTFSPGTTISSTEVNDNFTALKDGIDENKSVAECSQEVLPQKTLTTTVDDIAEVTITVPGPGRVMVSGSGTFRRDNNGDRWVADILITETSGGTGADVRNSWAGPAGLPNGLFASPFHEQAIFEVAAAGTFTYFLAGQNILVQPVTVLSASICAVFTPN